MPILSEFIKTVLKNYIYIAERENKDTKKELKKVSLYENNLGLRIEPASK